MGRPLGDEGERSRVRHRVPQIVEMQAVVTCLVSSDQRFLENGLFLSRLGSTDQDGRRIRALTIVDVFSREALAIEVGQRMRAENVVAVCNRLVARRGMPKPVFVDNGSEFSGRMFDLWAYHHGVRIERAGPKRSPYSTLGSPGAGRIARAESRPSCAASGACCATAGPPRNTADRQDSVRDSSPRA